MGTQHDTLSNVHHWWDAGQQLLAAGRYGAACTALEHAEQAAWRAGDARTLARLYLPLLEARRQMRYQAADGTLMICGRRQGRADSALQRRQALRNFLRAPAGTILLAAAARGPAKDAALKAAAAVRHEARRSGRWLEALLLLEHGNGVTRLAAPGDATFAAGLPVVWTNDPQAAVGISTDPALTIPLPPPERYTTGPLHGVARESLIVGWEALALKWQHRHAPRAATAWEELSWLRRTLQIDPACEPVTMRLIALAEGIERTPQ